MSVIDEKGRLFGKVNLLDLIIVVVVVAVVARVGYKWYQGRTVVTTGEAKTVQMTVKLPAVTDSTLKALHEGDEVFDSKSNALLGKIIAVRSESAWVTGATQEYKSQVIFDAYVTIEGPGRTSPNGVTMDGLEAFIGQTNYLRTVLWKGQGPTSAIQLLPAH
jgi:hypothetical protein